MNEDRIAHRIRQSLNSGLDNIPPAAQRRLEAARHHALMRQKQPAREMVMTGSGTAALSGDFLHRQRARQVLAVIALVIGMAIASYWHAHVYVSDLEDVDSALLTDDVPPEAFLDKGFAAWLDDSSED